MITRPVLEEQKKLYEQGRTQALADFNAFNGAIEACDNFLSMLDQADAAKEKSEADEAPSE